jgi:hypothetical protein
LAFEWDYYAIADLGLFAEGGFQVVGVDVQAGGGDDYVFFAAAKAEVTGGV